MITLIKNVKAILGLIILILVVILVWNFKNKHKIKQDVKRLERNIENIGFKLDSTKLINDNYMYTTNALQVKASELQYTNENLSKQLDIMGVKLKNAQSATSIKTNTVYEKSPADTVKVIAVNDSTFWAIHKTDWILLKEKIKVSPVGESYKLVIDSLHLEIKDNLYIVHEKTTKGWWFWKKVIGVKIHVTSDNPYTKIDRIESLNFVE